MRYLAIRILRSKILSVTILTVAKKNSFDKLTLNSIQYDVESLNVVSFVFPAESLGFCDSPKTCAEQLPSVLTNAQRRESIHLLSLSHTHTYTHTHTHTHTHTYTHTLTHTHKPISTSLN